MLEVLELFGGLGACSKALERLGVEHKIVDCVEIDRFAVKSFNAIHGTNFEPQDITKWDKDIKVDLIMHGSPCQDFSIAGIGRGGDEGSGTRSSLMYETLRIVEKLRPKYVIWENVKGVLSKKHKHNFDAYQERMAELGYKNYYQVLNAKDYGMPQNRERVFTVSILDGQEFHFPEPQPLTVWLKDTLEPVVDEKYYLSGKKVAKVKMSHPNSADDARCVQVADLNYYNYDKMNRVYSPEGLAPALETMGGGNREPKVAAEKIAGQALEKGLVSPYDVIDTSYVRARLEELERGTIRKQNKQHNQIFPTVKTDPKGYGVCVDEPDFCIRRLTPLECWRLMGFDDDDFRKAEKINSNTQLYKQAGNSIVVNVLEAILKNLLTNN